MYTFLFILFIGILGFVFIGSCVFAHLPLKRYTAGWWAGVILGLICIASAQSNFQKLPMTTKSVTSGCSSSYEDKVNWEPIISETTQVNWKVLIIGLILGIFGFEIIERLTFIPDKVISFFLLFLAFSSLGTLVYVFFIRKVSYIIFSFVMGTFLSWFLHIAFISRIFEKYDK